MTKITFEIAKDIVLKKEGGYTKNPKDSGNWTGGKPNRGVLKGTKFGISAKSYPDLDIKNLTRADAVSIYKRDYWDKIKADLLPEALRLTVFDMAVNAGVTRAAELLQEICNVERDGIIGPVTLSAAQSAGLEAYTKARKRHYVNLAEERPKDREFLEGWLSRADTIEAITKRLLK